VILIDITPSTITTVVNRFQTAAVNNIFSICLYRAGGELLALDLSHKAHKRHAIGYVVLCNLDGQKEEVCFYLHSHPDSDVIFFICVSMFAVDVNKSQLYAHPKRWGEQV
jgi:hypothetical protein